MQKSAETLVRKFEHNESIRSFKPDKDRLRICRDIVLDGNTSTDVIFQSCLIIDPRMEEGRMLQPKEKPVTNKEKDAIKTVICRTQEMCEVYRHAGFHKKDLPCAQQLQIVNKSLGQY